MSLSTLLIAILVIFAALSANMTLAWAVHRSSGNSGWIDVVWSFGLGAIGFTAALWPLGSDWPDPRQLLVAAMIAAWSARLGLHIARRTTAITDDPRYAELIRQYGDNARIQMLWLMEKQAIVTVPLAVSVFLAGQNPLPGLRPQDWLGLAILITGMAGATLADEQLRAFAADPANRGKVCDTGLWRYSRHPNYFFEFFGWCAYAVIALDLTGVYWAGWLTLAGPACIYWLLAHVSGIPPLEAHMLRSRGNIYRAYQQRTNAFFPGPVRRL